MSGEFSENGYYHNPSDKDDGWKVNPYSWNRIANMVFLESPAGVGFSVAGNGDVSSDDEKSGKENLQAMLSFFDKFPQYRSNEFYIAGESYAGIYVPFLAYYIDEHNKNATDDQMINLKGFMVGNGVTDWSVDCVPTMVEMMMTHALTSGEEMNGWKSQNCWIKNPLRRDHGYNMFNPLSVIDALDKQMAAEADKAVPAEEQWYAPQCYDLIRTIFSNRKDVNPYNINIDCRQGTGPLAKYVPCVWSDAAYNYFNRKDVQQALNIDSNFNGKWSMCSMDITNSYTKAERASKWIYPELMGKYRIMIYSGDSDIVVGFPGTMKWIKSLELSITENWRQWRTSRSPKQVAGYVERYEGLDLVTIRNGGHMVPTWAPEEGFYMFQQFLKNESL